LTAAARRFSLAPAQEENGQDTDETGGSIPMRSLAIGDFLIGLGVLLVIEGILFAASPTWMRKAMKSALATPDNVLRAVGIGSAVLGLILIWVIRRPI